MKRLLILFLGLILAMFSPSALAGKAAAMGSPLLWTSYRQAGWGDHVQIGCIDENGGVWLLEGSDYLLKWPHRASDQLDWLAGAKGFAQLAALDPEELFALHSLVACVPDQGSALAPAANDAGTQTSYALRRDSGENEFILLGASGDDRFENTDPGAQALYQTLRTRFPDIICYSGNPLMAPKGFQPVSLLEFSGHAALDLNPLKLKCTELDCETGAATVALSADEVKRVRAFIQNARVIAKQSCIAVTGGSTVYSFADADGEIAASFEFYRGLLVTEDGMYALDSAE